MGGEYSEKEKGKGQSEEEMAAVRADLRTLRVAFWNNATGNRTQQWNCRKIVKKPEENNKSKKKPSQENLSCSC